MEQHNKNTKENIYRYDQPLMINTICASCHKIIHFKQNYRIEDKQFIPISSCKEVV